MSEKKRQKKDGGDKNKQLQARRADNDEQRAAGAVRQARATARGDEGAQSKSGEDFSSPSTARSHASKTFKGKWRALVRESSVARVQKIKKWRPLMKGHPPLT